MLKPYLAATLNLFLPPQCLSCSEKVQAHGTLCLTCWEGMSFITEPMCRCCGYPFSYGAGDMLCANCIEEHPEFSAARSTFRFDDTSKSLIHKLKFQDETYLAKTLAVWLQRAGGEFLSGVDVIIPVPMHPKRLKERRYNQAALLARALSSHTNIPVRLDGLKKIKDTPSQTKLTRTQRLKNLAGAIVVSPARKALVSGKTVALVDDVMTTGTTANTCAKALLKAGASSVIVLTLARVAHDD